MAFEIARLALFSSLKPSLARDVEIEKAVGAQGLLSTNLPLSRSLRLLVFLSGREGCVAALHGPDSAIATDTAAKSNRIFY